MPIVPPPGMLPGDDDWERFDRSLSDLANQQGWDSWDDIISFDGSDIDEGNIRPGQYATPQDAIFNAYDIGILDYIDVIYDDETDAYYIVVTYGGTDQ